MLQQVKDKVRRTLLRWLQVMPYTAGAIVINETTTHELNAIKNRVWYRGDPSELEQFFHQAALDSIGQARFWAVSPSKGSNKIRKYHSGLPGMTVNVLADIVVTDMLNFELDDAGADKLWADIAEENGIKDVLTDAIQEVLVTGDGAFKISFDTDLSEYPIIEFFGGERVSYTLNRGRITEVQFLTRYDHDGNTHILTERYGMGYVRYELTDGSGEPADLDRVPELAGLLDASFDKSIRLAVPLKIYKSPKWEGRGRSIFDLKTDAYDSLDETISQWQDALRTSRMKRYIPKSLVPRNPETGEMLPVNPLDNVFTALEDRRTEGEQQTIITDQPKIDFEGLLATYVNNLDICLQGIISPSTLGIDTKKLDNAEAQREKEKTTLYTRDKIISVLQQVLPELVDAVMKANALANNQAPKEYTCTVEFGEYANPSFEAQVETVGKAAAHQIMSIETQVETLWGDTRDDEWKREEVERLMMEKGVMTLDDPMGRPHGFIDGELDDDDAAMDSRDDRRDGARDAGVNGSKSPQSSKDGARGGLPVDAMAGAAAKEPEPVGQAI